MSEYGLAVWVMAVAFIAVMTVMNHINDTKHYLWDQAQDHRELLWEQGHETKQLIYARCADYD